MKIVWLISAIIFGVVGLFGLIGVITGVVGLFLLEDTNNNYMADLMLNFIVLIVFGGLYWVTQDKYHKLKK